MNGPTSDSHSPVCSALPAALERSIQPCAVGRIGDRVSGANAALIRLLRHDPGTVTSEQLALALTSAEGQAAEEAALAELERTGQPQCYRKEVIRRDGSRLKVEVLVQPFPSAGQDWYLATYQELEPDRRGIVPDTPDGIVVADLGGSILEMNRTALRLHGLGSFEEARQCAGHYNDCFDLFYPDGRVMPLAEWPISRAMRGETFSDYEVLLRDRDSGERRTYSYCGARLGNGVHPPHLALITIRDITDGASPDKEALSLANFPVENPQPVLRVDAQGTILYANPASRTLLVAWGRKEGQALPENLYQEVSLALTEGTHRVLEIEAGEQSFELDLVPALLGRHVNIYGRDVSRRKAMERARERDLQRLQALASISRLVLVEASMEGLLCQVTQGARELTAARWSTAAYGYENGGFQIGTYGQAGSSATPPEGSVTAEALEQVYLRLQRQGPSLRLTDAELRSHPDWWGPGEHPPQGLLGVRLMDASGRPNGLILVSDSLEGGFTEGDEALLSQLAAMASLSLRHIQARQEAEERSRESKAILDSIADGVWVYDPRGNITHMNSAARRLTGYGEDYLVQAISNGKTSVRVLSGEGDPLPPEAFPVARALKGETVRSFVLGIESPNGELLWLSSSAAPVHDAHGRMLGVVVTSTDITALRRANEQLESRRTELLALSQDLEVERGQLAATLHSIGDAVMAVDPEGFMVLMNPAAEGLTGWSEDDLKERTLPQLLDYSFCLHHPGGEPIPAQDWPFPEVLSGEPLSGLEIELHSRQGGKSTILACSFQPVRDSEGRLLLTVLAARDITVEKQLQWERQRLEELKSNFVANTSHELRTPLASVMGYTELLLSGGAGDLNPLQREFIQTVYESSERLHWLIDDILDVSRMESVSMDLEQARVDVPELIRGVVERLRPKADQQRIRVEMHLPAGLPTVLGDPRRLEQVFGNLLSNAIKYTPEGGRATLAAARRGRWLEVMVSDTGVGIAPEDLPHMFERFHRGRHAINESIGGTGLGLYISKSVIEAHHGRIEVESQVGRGSRFRVLLPIPGEESDDEA